MIQRIKQRQLNQLAFFKKNLQIGTGPMVALVSLVACMAYLGCTAMAAEPTNAAPKPDASRGEQLYSNGDPTRNIVACASCHGPGGNSVGAANPKLAAQHASYIYKQLSNFKPQAAGAKPSRENAVMNSMAANLSTLDMQDIAAYLATQTLKPAVAKNKDTVALGQKIYRAGITEKGVPACAACHSPNGAGIPAQYPRLGGQFAEYTAAQLTAFKQGVRKNGPMMTTIAARLSEQEIQAVSDYIAGLR